jgi:hypothetical protein
VENTGIHQCSVQNTTPQALRDHKYNNTPIIESSDTHNDVFSTIIKENQINNQPSGTKGGCVSKRRIGRAIHAE